MDSRENLIIVKTHIMAFPKPHLFSDDHQLLANLMKAFSCPARLYILKKLEKKDMYVHEFVRDVRLSKGTMTEHLQKLKSCGLVDVEVQGLYNKYMLNAERLREVSRVFQEFIHEFGFVEAGEKEKRKAGRGRRKLSRQEVVSREARVSSEGDRENVGRGKGPGVKQDRS